MLLIETNGSMWGQLCLSECYIQLTTAFRSGLCAGFLYELMPMAVGWRWDKNSWDKNSWDIQTQISGSVALCSTVTFSSSS